MSTVTMTVKLGRAFLSGILLLPLLHACSPLVPPATLPAEEAPASQAQDYILGSEDSVEVQVWKNPDLSRTVTVRPDGKISLPLIGDVQAAGLTAVQLTEAVTEKLKAYYREPAQVTVIVNPVNSYTIYFVGEVRSSGPKQVRSNVTFLQAVSVAGGFTPYASTNKITLRRRDNDGKEVVIPIRYKDILAGNQANIVLRPGDTIIVP
jgi:polysaccharide export outer membrane protein